MNLGTKRKDRASTEETDVRNLLDRLQAYNATIPDEAVTYLLEKSGCQCNDVRLKRLVAVAAQKFLMQVLQDAKAHKSHSLALAGIKDKKEQQVLSMEELSKSLRDNGIQVEKPEFFAHSALGL